VRPGSRAENGEQLDAPRTWVRLIIAAILVVGLGGALAIYLTAEPVSGDLLGREDSRQYLRAMELYGGKANILAAELLDWFQSLWHGRRLAVTVACTTVLAAAAVWLVDVVSQE
jgi:hypothetical protein